MSLPRGGHGGVNTRAAASREAFREDETPSIRDPHRKHQNRPVARVTERLKLKFYVVLVNENAGVGRKLLAPEAAPHRPPGSPRGFPSRPDPGRVCVPSTQDTVRQCSPAPGASLPLLSACLLKQTLVF